MRPPERPGRARHRCPALRGPLLPALVPLLAAALACCPAHGAAQDPGAAGPSAPAGAAWDDRGGLVLEPQEALDALEALPADLPAPQSWGQGGSRKGWFGEAWVDVDGDGCDTRNEILARDLSQADYSRSPGAQGPQEARGAGASVCPDATVWSGTLQDPYTGATIAFQRGQDTSAAVQIDHVVPLNYLYAHGAWSWPERTRLLVANDPLNLLAVDGDANEAKGACGPATCPMGSSETGTWQTAAGQGWWPANREYRCQYAQRFVSVASAYGLGLPQPDRDALRSALSDCLAGGDGTTSVLEDAAGTAREVGSRMAGSTVSLGLVALGALILGWGLIARGARGRRRAGARRRRSGRRR
nr:HNH endonuclease family protein [Actinomyces bowdenii]